MWYPYTPQYLHKKPSPTLHADRIQNPILHLSKHDVSDLLQVTLNSMYFSFRDQVFGQREGLRMGSSISGILAILFMDNLETIALSSHLMISPYKRYVDDIYLQTSNEETADHFHHIINNVHPNLKFEIEKPKQHRVACHCHYSISKSPYPRRATALLSSTKSQPRNHYSSTINQLSHQIQTQLHSQRAKTHRGQMLLK